MPLYAYHTGAVTGVARLGGIPSAPDACVSVSADASLRVWNGTTCMHTRTLASALTAVATHPILPLVFMGDVTGRVHTLWISEGTDGSTLTSALLHTDVTHTGVITSVAFAPQTYAQREGEQSARHPFALSYSRTHGRVCVYDFRTTDQSSRPFAVIGSADVGDCTAVQWRVGEGGEVEIIAASVHGTLLSLPTVDIQNVYKVRCDGV